ncbi:MAG: SgcJ/EcaC family oxidoreductase [Acidobacteria bacterium]|nr:MAG: SgcJ/EcaC family oxidoreductase [Acidobacteriota bacterium]
MQLKLVRLLSAALLPLLLLSGSAVAADPVSQQSAIEKAVLEAMAKIEQAAERLEAGSFYDLALPEGSIIQNGRLFASSEEARKSIEQAYQGIEKQEITFRRQQVTVVSPTVALVTAESDSSATLTDGREIAATSAWTVLFVLRDGQWKVLHAHTSVPPRQ